MDVAEFDSRSRAGSRARVGSLWGREYTQCASCLWSRVWLQHCKAIATLDTLINLVSLAGLPGAASPAMYPAPHELPTDWHALR